MKSLFAICSVFAFISGITFAAGSMDLDDYIEGINVSLDKEKIFKNWNEILLELLQNPNIASKEWIYNQYDYQVQNNTIIAPGKADAAVIRLRGTSKNKNTNPVLINSPEVFNGLLKSCISKKIDFFIIYFIILKRQSSRNISFASGIT